MWPISSPSAVRRIPTSGPSNSTQLADVVQDGPGDDQRFVEWRLQIRVVGRVLVRQKAGVARHRKDVLQKSSEVRVMVLEGSRAARLMASACSSRIPTTNRRRGSLSIRSWASVRSSTNIGFDIETGRFDECRFIETVRAIRLFYRADFFEFELQPVRAFHEATANLVERAHLPCGVARFE